MAIKTQRVAGIWAVAIAISVVGVSRADHVTLQNATATYSQTNGGQFTVNKAIDGSFDPGSNGWAIGQPPISETTNAETAVFETASDIGLAGGTLLTFSLYQLHSNPQHNLGRFRLSVTTDDRSQFADGLATGGDVTANWAPLHPLTASSTGGTLLSVLGDSSILASGPNPDTSVYTVTAETNLLGITGIRLEALEDPSLPQNGPGRRSENGNFVLTEFQVDASAVPEPGSLVLLALGGLAVSVWLIRQGVWRVESQFVPRRSGSGSL